MTFDRRNFLRVLGVTGASAALSPLSAIAIDEDLYTNSRLGFSLTKPRGWHFNSAHDFKRMAERQAHELAQPELQQEFLEIAGHPILVVTRYSDEAHPDRLTPNIQVYADPITSDSPEAFLKDCDSDKHLLGDYFENFKIEREMRMSRLGSRSSGVYDFSFDWVHDDTRHQLLARSVLVQTATAELSFNFTGTLTGPERCEGELVKAMESIRLS